MRQTTTQKKDKLLKYVLYGCILMLGVAIGLAIRHYYNIPLVEAINIVDVATLIVTIFLAVYIPGVFDRQLQVKQEKKELVEKRIEGLQELYYKINQIVQQEVGSANGIYIIDNTLDLSKNRLKIVITLLEYLSLDETFEEELAQIRTLDSRYRALLVDAIAKGEEALFSEEVKNGEEVLYNRLDQATSLLIFKINDI